MRHAFDVPGGQKRRVPPAQPPLPGLRFWLSAVTVSVLASILFVEWGFDGCRGMRPSAGNNLRVIGQSGVLYAIEHEGRFPESFEVLVDAYEEDLSPAVFINPRGAETAAHTFEQMFSEPGHMSFIWSGRGLTMDNICEESVLAYQSRPTRSDGRIWVAYADGTTRHVAPGELHSRLRATADIVGGELWGLDAVECTLIAPRAISASPE